MCIQMCNLKNSSETGNVFHIDLKQLFLLCIRREWLGLISTQDTTTQLSPSIRELR